MKDKWDIEYYETRIGDTPVEEFINKLRLEAREKVFEVLDLLREFGVMISYPHVKKIAGTKLWELRTSGGSAVRIFYVAKAKKVFLLLHGFVKKTNRTPEKELKIALKRFLDYESRY